MSNYSIQHNLDCRSGGTSAFRKVVSDTKAFVKTVGLIAVVAALTPTLSAQWRRYPTPDVPKTPDGKPNLSAAAPRTREGKPDLSGIWQNVPCRDCVPQAAVGTGLGPVAPAGAAGAAPSATNRGSGRGPSLFADVGSGVPGGLPLQPWAAEVVKKRMADNSKDNPDAHCLPLGIMQFNTHPYPRKIIQTPRLIAIIYEVNTWVRQIYLDNRPLPNNDPEPWWNGYSTARWEGDVLVVETTDFRDDGWLDINGNPLTSTARMTERFRRPSYGSLEIVVTIEDPKAYAKPFTVTVNQRIMLDTEMIEFVCVDKDAQHYVGK